MFARLCPLICLSGVPLIDGMWYLFLLDYHCDVRGVFLNGGDFLFAVGGGDPLAIFMDFYEFYVSRISGHPIEI